MSARRIAVVDLGTNSTRLLVADVEDGRVAELDRSTQITRLGEGVDESGRLSESAMGRVFETLAGYGELIERHGPERVVGVATSAVRDAENGDEFRDELRERFGVEVRTIPGGEEARLTFLGATGGRDPGVDMLVIDIGGGSTEYVVGTPGADPGFHVSSRLGSVRQTERHIEHDPPAHDEVESLARGAAAIVAADVPEQVRGAVDVGVAVAGTATSLAAIDQALEPYDPERVHGYRLGLGACERMLSELAAKTTAQRRDLAGLHPDRAPTIVAGAVILVESIRAFGLDAVETSEADILHGTALDAVADAPG
jgi:exopolyphosphatase / guanosine-5'-triphosphate,3'-diphosphate pyrophosphatase